MLEKDDVLHDASFMLKGYHREMPLVESEWQVLRTLIACRLCCTITMSFYSYSLDPGNEYLLITQEPGWRALKAFTDISEADATAAFKRACGL